MLSIWSQIHLLKGINRTSFWLVRCQIKCKKETNKIKSEQNMLLGTKLRESMYEYFLTFMINTGLFWEGEGQVWRAGDRFANQNSRMLWSAPNEGKEITQKVSFSGHVCKRTELCTQVILWRIEVMEQGIRSREKTSICFSEALWEHALNPTLLCLGATAGEFWAHLENSPEAAGTPSHPSTQVTGFGADGHWLFAGMLWGGSSG